MAELTTAKYQIKLPFPILVNGEEILAQDPIKVTTPIGEAVIYPPGSKTMKPESYIEPQQAIIEEVTFSSKDSSLWEADTIWIDLTTDITPPISFKEPIQQLDSEMNRILLWLLKLLRQRCPEPPMPLPKHPDFAVSIEHDPRLHAPIHAYAFKGAAFRVVSQGAGLTGERWEEVRQDIASGTTPELYDEFILDAKTALDEEDLIRAILYAAIGCENFIKEYAEKAAKEAGIDQKFWRYLKGHHPGVHDYYDSILRLIKHRSLKDDNLHVYEQIEYLFRARNSIMHAGKRKPQYKDKQGNEVTPTVPAVRQFIDGVSQAISWVREL